MADKAKIAKVNLGFTEIEGLLLSSQEYAVGIPQIADLFQASRNTASRDFRRLLDEDFQASKAVTEFNTNPINVVSIEVVSLIAFELAKKGNKLADKYIKAALIESIERRFDIAFDKKRSEEEYNARLKARVQGKKVRWDFTDSIKAYIQRNNITGNEAKFMYKNATDRLYANLTGYSSTKKLREKQNIPLKATPKDYASERDLRHIAEIEAAAQRYIDLKNIHPCDAIDFVTQQLLLKNIGWSRMARL